jgi:hypothetical protein
MKNFMDDDFLLHTPTAHKLYFEHAANMPIIDYHCHLDPKMVAENQPFKSITELWLGGDHYKWRALRANGIDERYITGTDTSDWEKFVKWAETVPYTLRNPLYHWTHLELKTAFGIDKRLNPDTAKEIYEACNAKLKEDPQLTPWGLLNKYRVEVVCTTDDPTDDLRYHQLTKECALKTKMLPTWRPDKAMSPECPDAFRAYAEKLAAVSGIDIHNFNDFLDALQQRHDFFNSMGCRLSDHGIEKFYAEPYTDNEIKIIFDKVYGGYQLSAEETLKFKSAMLYIFGIQDHAAGWTQQYHYGAMRNNNTRMFDKIGADTGFDSIGEYNTAKECSRFLDRLDQEGRLSKTILYNLNPNANEVLATMIGNFQDGTIPGKIQWGSGWWFMDQKNGMQNQLNTLSLLGLLSRFVGMLTDSRSFLSYPRHEYFRRILCDLIGTDIENGELPYTGYEQQRINQMVEDVCYYNAKQFFNF